jgi:hypothetical protein
MGHSDSAAGSVGKVIGLNDRKPEICGSGDNGFSERVFRPALRDARSSDDFLNSKTVA